MNINDIRNIKLADDFIIVFGKYYDNLHLAIWLEKNGHTVINTNDNLSITINGFNILDYDCIMTIFYYLEINHLKDFYNIARCRGLLDDIK